MVATYRLCIDAAGCSSVQDGRSTLADSLPSLLLLWL
jgi:hypothetical protein